MAVRDPEIVQIVGTAPTYHAASAGGDKVSRADNDVVLHVKNGSASEITATVVTPGTVAGQAIGDVAVAVPAAGARFIGPLSRQHFANADGQVDLTWSATTTVTFAVIEL